MLSRLNCMGKCPAVAGRVIDRANKNMRTIRRADRNKWIRFHNIILQEGDQGQDGPMAEFQTENDMMVEKTQATRRGK
jgi:hypothetical protein